MYAQERQQAIAAQVAERGRVSVLELADAFGVTTETVRRDLSTLEGLQLLRRVHGGALPISSATMLEPALVDRVGEHFEEKQRIALAAVALLPPTGATILIDAGSTTVRLAAALPRAHPYTVYTHSITVASTLADLPNVELHLLPGRLRRTTHAAVGVDTVEALGRIRVDVTFLGANGVSGRHGCSTPDHAEAATKAAMVRSGNRTILLADSSKLGQEFTVRFADLAEVDTVVTDSDASEEQRDELARHGPEVVAA